MTSQQIEHIAWNLKARHPGQDVAFLEYEGKLFYSIDVFLPGRPFSAITQLIQGAYSQYQDQARRLVRCRIYSTAEPTEMCLGMVQVAAKRLTSNVCAKNHSPQWSTCDATQLIPASPLAPPAIPSTLAITNTTDAQWMAMAQSLADQQTQGRKIGAVLVSSEGQVIATGVSQVGFDRTLHAEVTLLQSHYHQYQKPLPKGSRLFTTLKPCKMCAGMIVNCADDSSDLEVIYRDFDPGPHGRRTILDEPTNSMTRLRRL